MPRLYRVFWRDGEVDRVAWRCSIRDAKKRLIRVRQEVENPDPHGMEPVDVPIQVHRLELWLNANCKTRERE